MIRFTTFLVVIGVICTSAHGARILGVFHMAAYSHFQLGDKIFKELAARGHEVTVVSPYPEKAPTKNLKTVQLTGMIEELEERKMNMFKELDMNILQKIVILDMVGLEFAEKTLNNTNFQALLKSNKKFDIVIMEQFVNEAFRGICHHYNAVCVVVSTVGGSRWTNPQMGNPGNPSYIPDIYLSFSSRMNFCERLYNTVIYLTAELYYHAYTLPKHNALLQKYFPNAPHIHELYYNTSLMLVNSHVSTNPAVPYVPNMVEIGGYHVNAPKKLPKDIDDYLSGAKDGAIFFSMGSNLKSKDLPPEKRDILLKVFSKLKQKVLWKWEDDTLPGQPTNVKLGKWLPQQDVLAHPNLKLFITHGGLLSTTETIYHGVPIVGIPVYGDQEMNVANAEIAGFGIGVPYKTVTEASLAKAIDEVLTNPKYAENAKARSKIMHDQPMKPLDKAIFWIEYVFRHRGAPHLRTAALNLSWYQYLLLDVVAFLVLIPLVIILIVCCLMKRKFCCKTTVAKTDSKKKKKMTYTCR